MKRIPREIKSLHRKQRKSSKRALKIEDKEKLTQLCAEFDKVEAILMLNKEEESYRRN